jgi:hypothetical protein
LHNSIAPAKSEAHAPVAPDRKYVLSFLLEAKVDHLKAVVGKVKGVAVATHVPEIANHVPHFVASWDEAALGLKAKQAHERLQAGDPPLHVLLTGPGQLTVSVRMMQGDEHRIAARLLRDVLATA